MGKTAARVMQWGSALTCRRTDPSSDPSVRSVVRQKLAFCCLIQQNFALFLILSVTH